MLTSPLGSVSNSTRPNNPPSAERKSVARALKFVATNADSSLHAFATDSRFPGRESNKKIVFFEIFLKAQFGRFESDVRGSWLRVMGLARGGALGNPQPSRSSTAIVPVPGSTAHSGGRKQGGKQRWPTTRTGSGFRDQVQNH